MDKRTVTAQEVRDAFLVEDIEQAVAEIAQTVGELLDYKTSEELLVNCCTSLPEEQRQGLSRYDRLCWIARRAFLAGYLQATETLLETAKTGYTALFAGGTGDRVIALISYRLLQGIVEPLRGGVAV